MVDNEGMKVSSKLRPSELRIYREWRKAKAESLRQYRRWSSNKSVKARNSSARYFTALDFRTA